MGSRPEHQIERFPLDRRDRYGDPLPGVVTGNSPADNRRKVATGAKALAKGFRMGVGSGADFRRKQSA